MKYKAGMDVLTVGGHRVGRVKAVVMTPRTQEITHLVVERGFLLTEEKVLPLSWIAHVNEQDAVILYKDEDAFDTLPAFTAEAYVPAEEADSGVVFPPAYYYYGGPGMLPLYDIVEPNPSDEAGRRYVETTVENIPDGTVALHMGAEVISRDDQHVGNVEQILADARGENATHFLISKGLFFHTRKLIPASWIDRVAENTVYLSVSAAVLDRLPDYDRVAM
jgi:uncharacterized protein YrrD